MWEFYRKIGWQMATSLRQAVYAVEAFVGVVFFVALLCSRSWSEVLEKWEWINPQWLWWPIGIISAHLFLKAVYDVYKSREDALLEELKQERAADSSPVDSESAAWQELLRESREHIDALAQKVPTPKVDGVAGVVNQVMSDYHRAVHGSPSRDWKSETKSALRALVNEQIVRQYEGRLQTDSPELAAKEYLLALATSLVVSDLRGHRTESAVPENNSHPNQIDALNESNRRLQADLDALRNSTNRVNRVQSAIDAHVADVPTGAYFSVTDASEWVNATYTLLEGMLNDAAIGRFAGYSIKNEYDCQKVVASLRALSASIQDRDLLG